MALVAALVAGGVFLLGMVAATGYALRTLPADAGVPLHAGAPEYSVWLAKRAGLAAWLGIGAAAFAVFAALTVSGIARYWAPSVRVVLLPSVMCVVFAAEGAAIISARRRGTAERVPAVPPAMDAPSAEPAGAEAPSTEPAGAENQ